MVTVKQLTKYYEQLRAIDAIRFEVEKGEIFGLIGPDGAGKTTIFRILTSLLIPDEGHAALKGFDVVKDYRQIRQIVGYMPGRFSLYQDLSVEENLNFFATVFGTTIQANYELVKDIYQQIEPFKDRLAGNLSGGMKQKLALSCALIHKPDVLILDEPTTGVDAVSRREFWEMLQRLKEKGITILVSTPYMDEASLCDRVALIQQGGIMQIDTPQGIVKQYRRKLLAVTADDLYRLKKDLNAWPKTHTVFLFGQYLHYTQSDGDADANALQAYLEEKGHTGIVIKPATPGIEDSFMELMLNPEVNESKT